MSNSRKISMVLADVDGTLLTEDKVLTERAKAAVQSLHRAQIRFAITSGRPPRGMSMLFDPLGLDTPIAGFNGGLFVEPDLSILERKTIPSEVAHKAIELIRGHQLDVWVYRGNEWLITDPEAPHVDRETSTVEFQPKVVDDLDDYLDEAVKIVGISDDDDRMKRCEADAQDAFGQRATAARSQPYYLDITHADANKGAVLEYLSRHLDVAPSEIATIGDQPNDVLMFKPSGFSIAMGNASDDVKSQADATTDSYNDEGFAKAIERFILASPD
ncbi:MAG: Cof-type HAD-IIB family hydrolase [Myxococcales bacterium]|jgi:Cof subfamily protein (haloacid dehalogenase superfamily)